MKRKITILGMGPSASEKRAEIVNYCVGEIWSLNNAYIRYPELKGKFARFFELHGWDYLKKWTAGNYSNGSEVDHFYELDCLGCPIYVTQSIPAVKAQFAYPYVPVFDHFGSDSIYWLGSPSLMLSLAIWEHDTGQEIDEIRSWGIDTGDPSHAQQRQSWSWWCAKAQDRGIKMTGTPLAYHDEPDNDEGLAGLREIIREQFPVKGENDNFKVLTAATPGYYDAMKRLQGQAKARGIECEAVEIGKDENQPVEALTFVAHHHKIWTEQLEKSDKPILWIDADDEIQHKFNLPGGCDVAYIANPELKVMKSRLKYGAVIAIWPTGKGKKFLAKWAKMTESGFFGNAHQSLNACIVAPPEGCAMKDATLQLRNAIKINPNNIHRHQTVTT